VSGQAPGPRRPRPPPAPPVSTAWRDCINVDFPLIYRAPEEYDTNYSTYGTFAYTTNPSTPPPAING